MLCDSKFQSTPSARRATPPPWAKPAPRCHFNPRPPRGERRDDPAVCICLLLISIHALREESDLVAVHSKAVSADFNPRPPRGERFLAKPAVQTEGAISIHALREESDSVLLPACWACSYFNPRPPRGERRGFGDDAFAYWAFQSTLSVGRATGAGNHHPGGA